MYAAALMLIGMGIPVAQAQESLPQTPIAAAALIMQWATGPRDAQIEIQDDDHARLKGYDAHLVRVNGCKFRLIGYSNGQVDQINFEHLSSEYTTVAETDHKCLLQGKEPWGYTCLQYGNVPNGRTTLTVKGRYEWDPRQPGKSPLCEGKVALAEAKQAPTAEKIHFLPGPSVIATCRSRIWTQTLWHA